MKRFLAFCCTLVAVSSAVENAFADFPRGNLARAKLENGVVTVRWFMMPYVAVPGTERPGSPTIERREARIQFNAGDIRTYHPDGKTVDAAIWQVVLAKESSVLFVGHSITDSNTGTPGSLLELNLTPDERNVYRPDLLVLFGARSPVTQERAAQNTKLPQGMQPRFGTAVVGADGMLHVTELRKVNSHYFAPRAGGGNTHIFQDSTTTTTRALPPADVRVWTPDGKQIAAASLPQWLSKEYSVMITGDGNEVDPAYLELLRPNTPVIAVPVLPPPLTTPLAAPPPK